jgi:hypothetical protein
MQNEVDLFRQMLKAITSGPVIDPNKNYPLEDIMQSVFGKPTSIEGGTVVYDLREAPNALDTIPCDMKAVRCGDAVQFIPHEVKP